MIYFLIYILLINLLGFILMKVDKYYAINQKYRISEKTFFIISAMLGSLGVYIGMYTFRHKTKHINFTVMVPVLFILNIITVYTIFKYNLLCYIKFFLITLDNNLIPLSPLTYFLTVISLSFASTTKVFSSSGKIT